jgi:hypothetical protein
VLRASLVVQRPDQRGPAEQVSWQLRKPDVIGLKTGDDLLADSPDRRSVVTHQMRGHFLFPRGAGVLHLTHQRHVPPDVLAQQLVRLQEVVLVVLFDDVQALRLAEGSKVHRRRVDGGGDVHEAKVRGACRELHASHVANERKVRIVDRQRKVDLIVER